MAYRLKRKDGSVQKAVRRVACEQIDKAIAATERLDPADAVHDVRKRCKKLRGLIRLVRPSFAAYKDENAVFRDIAALISDARDAKVMQDTYDLLVSHYSDRIDRRALGSIRRRFTLDRKAAGGGGEDVRERLAKARDRLLAARERAGGWNLNEKDWAAIGGGLEKTYARACEASESARACSDGETFHELRKRIKYHWYHCRLLENLWPEMMTIRTHLARELSDLLGDHHDLTVFQERLSADPASYGNPADVEIAIGLALACKSALEQQAWPKVDRLLAQPPGALADHFEGLWAIWQSESGRAAQGAA